MREITIASWAAGGRGVGRVDGRVWLVEGAMPGDRVAAAVVRDRGRYVEARAVRLEEASPTRRPPPCPLQTHCGGCPLMVADENEQRAAKRTFLADALARIGRLHDVPIGRVAPAPADFGYRNRIELTFGRDGGGRRILGYHRGGSEDGLLDVPACAIADPRVAPLVAATRAFFLEGDGRDEPAIDLTRDPIRAVFRVSRAGTDRLIALRGPGGPFPTAPAFAEQVSAAVPDLTGVVRIVSVPGRRGSATTVTLRGRPFVEDSVLGIRFRVPAAAFLQVHGLAAESLLRHVLDGAGSPRRAVELYAGVGALALALARGGASVTSVEADPEAVACGREAAEREGPPSVVALRGDVRGFLEAPPRSAVRPDFLVADPPRTGLGRGVAEGIARLAPDRVAMISCDPATLARDLAALVRAGYELERVVPFDLFPQTAHVEAVAWLSKPKGTATVRRP